MEDSKKQLENNPEEQQNRAGNEQPKAELSDSELDWISGGHVVPKDNPD